MKNLTLCAKDLPETCDTTALCFYTGIPAFPKNKQVPFVRLVSFLHHAIGNRPKKEATKEIDPPQFETCSH